MLLHVDAVKYKCKPTKAEIGGIKKRFTKSASIKDLSVRQIADCLTAGRTIQPGVTPFSAKSSAKGYKGTNADDFSCRLFSWTISTTRMRMPQRKRQSMLLPFLRNTI